MVWSDGFVNEWCCSLQVNWWGIVYTEGRTAGEVDEAESLNNGESSSVTVLGQGRACFLCITMCVSEGILSCMIAVIQGSKDRASFQNVFCPCTRMAASCVFTPGQQCWGLSSVPHCLWWHLNAKDIWCRCIDFFVGFTKKIWYTVYLLTE